MSITKTKIIVDSRKPGQAGIVVAEHTFDDGQVWPAIFECKAGEDPEVRLDAMVSEREAQKTVNDTVKSEYILKQQAETKLDGYINSLSPQVLLDANFNNEEIVVLKKEDR